MRSRHTFPTVSTYGAATDPATRAATVALATLATLLAIAPGRGAPAAERIRYADLVSRLTDLERLATPVVPGERTGASTSHDRRSSYDPASGTYRSWAANADGGGFIRREGEGFVMVELEGPGVLWRTWSALPEAGHIAIYLDGSASPIVDKPFRAWFDDLEEAYPGLAMTLSRGRNEFVPVSFARSCRVVVRKGWGRYFHATHTLFPEGTRVEPFPGFTPEVDALLRRASDAWLRRGESPHPRTAGSVRQRTSLAIPPGEQRTISRDGSGAIRELRVRPLGLPNDRIAREDVLREITISLHWDGEARPSVWSPLGDFFATSPGLNPFRTLPMGCVDGWLYSYWHMPFADGMRLVLRSDGETERRVAVELETVPLEPAEASRLLRFCAAWHPDDFTGLDAERFARRGGDRWPDWPLLVVEGRGRYVGMAEHVWKFGGWWGEGDERFFVDGEVMPSTVGTGSEDYIGYAWAANPPFVTFDSALAACSRLRPDAQEDTSVCRFHVCDDIPFTRGFQGFIEVMPNGDCRPCVYDTCVYWYREAGARNPYPVRSLAERRHPRPPRTARDVVPSTMEVAAAHPDAIEGEALKVVSIGSGRHWIQDMTGYPGGVWSRGAQLIWTEGRRGEAVEIEFDVPEAGDYELIAVFTKAVDYGIFELSLDGTPLGRRVDLHDTRVTTTPEISLGRRRLARGAHRLGARVVGRSSRGDHRTGNYLFGLDYLRLVAC